MRLEEPVPRPAEVASPVAETCIHLPDLFLHRADATPDDIAFRIKQDGLWVTTRWRDALAEASAVATFLSSAGVHRLEKVAILGGTQPKWCIADMGGLLAGAVTVGAYPTLSDPQLAYLLQHSDARVVFVQDAAERDRVVERWHQCPMLERVVVWDDDTGGIDNVTAWSNVLETPVDEGELAARRSEVNAADCAIIVYTSGTTGSPKGAMISHRNILSLIGAGIGFPFARDEESFSFLPMAHVAERILGFYQRTNQGTATTFASSIPAVLEEVKEVRPTLFGSVPRIFEKAHAKIQASVAEGSAVKRGLFRWAESVGKTAVAHWQDGRTSPLSVRWQHALADRLVFSKIREAFGGRVRFFVTGAAPIPEEVLRFFWAAGFPIFETYGMTESTAITHINRPGACRLGSVGRALANVECRLADDGEVLVRGDTVFIGYYKNDEATAEMIDDEGWLHTGDIGRIDDDGYLFIVDRKKHIIITAGGKNLSPANIENEIKATDPLISQVHAFGNRRPYVTAMVTLGPMESIRCAVELGLATETDVADLEQALLENPLARPKALGPLMEAVTERPEIRERVAKAVRRGNEQLANVERVRKVYLLDRELSVDRDELTPTLKTKRKNIDLSFASTFDRLYEDEAFGITILRR